MDSIVTADMSVEQYEKRFKDHMEPLMEKLYSLCDDDDACLEDTTLNVVVHGRDVDRPIMAIGLTRDEKTVVRVLIKIARESGADVQCCTFAVRFITQILARLTVKQEKTRNTLLQSEFVAKHRHSAVFNQLWNSWWCSKIQEDEAENSSVI